MLRANGLRRLRVRRIGPLLSIDVALNGSLYGISAGNESSVDVDDIDAADDAQPSGLSAEFGSSMRDGVNASGDDTIVLTVARGVNTGRLVFTLDVLSTSRLFEKVFLAVGEVADSVSSRRLVELLPMIGATSDVFNESFGRFAGDGVCSCGTRAGVWS